MTSSSPDSTRRAGASAVIAAAPLPVGGGRCRLTARLTLPRGAHRICDDERAVGGEVFVRPPVTIPAGALARRVPPVGVSRRSRHIALGVARVDHVLRKPLTILAAAAGASGGGIIARIAGVDNREDANGLNRYYAARSRPQSGSHELRRQGSF
jgi:hypothetical protein